MCQYDAYRSGFRFLFACIFLLTFLTGCKSESFRGESGSGHKIGIAVAPVAAILTAIMAALFGYLVWRRISK